MRWMLILLFVALILVGFFELIRKLRERRSKPAVSQTHHDRLWTGWRWSQDGWIRKDLLTGDWQYGGDGDHANENGPIS